MNLLIQLNLKILFKIFANLASTELFKNNQIKPMNRYQTRTAVYKAIVKDGKSHQETFDDLSTKTTLDQKWLANEIAKFPTKNANEKQNVLRYIYMGLLVLAILLRLIWIFSAYQVDQSNNSALVLLAALGILIPMIGIIGSIKRNIQSYTTIAIIGFINIFRTISYFQNTDNPLLLIGLFPYVGIIILALYIPTKLKTPYKIEIIEGTGPNGVDVLINEKYIFETPLMESESELLDN